VSEVSLHPTGEADLPDLIRLWNDGRVMRWVGFPRGLGYDLPKMREWLRRLQADGLRHHFVVRTPQGAFCGEVYYAVDREHRRAGLDIKLLPRVQGRGIASTALQQLIELVFTAEKDIDAVWTEPSGKNQAARNLYGRCGLKPAARPRDMGEGESYWELRRSERT